MWTVQVWFATSSWYRQVFAAATEAEAIKEARAYRSDSKGIRVISPDGEVQQFKAESVL